jgi:diacylglycerol kinase (ATP)
MTPQHITFILNPAAGRGKALHIQAALQAALEHSTLNYEFHLTSGPGDATQLARSAGGRSSIVVAVGGDGTVNEVATGLVGMEAAMAVMSEGSGNDFGRMVSAPTDPASLIALLRSHSIKKYDAGQVRLQHANGTKTEHSFFNSIGLGFDAAVAKKVSSIRWMRGIPLYLTALLQTLAGYQPHRFIVTNGTERLEKNYFLLCIGNGKWEGGGFKLTPNAVPDDGIFEVCGVTGDSIYSVLPVLPSVMTGSHLGKKHIESFNTSSLTVECAEGFPIHGDGEIFGWNVQTCEISIVPGALNVVLPHKV